MKARSRVRSNVEVWFPEDDGGSSVQEFRFDPHNYGRAANWVLRDVLDDACGDVRCCDRAGGSTFTSATKLHRVALSILIKQYTTTIFYCKP
jgi:hypothetical protein